MKRRERRVAVVLAVMAAMFFGFAGSALAAAYYFNGTLERGGIRNGQDVYLKQNTARKLDGGSGRVCVNAINTNGGGFAGQDDCVTGNGALASHPYCACELKRAVVLNKGSASAEVRAQYFILGD